MKLIQLLTESESGWTFFRYVNDFKGWYKKYQRSGNQNIPSELLSLLGNPRMVDYSKQYTLYRGIYFSQYNVSAEQMRKLKSLIRGNILPNKSISWSFDKNTARSFAYGSTHHFDSPKFRVGDIGFLLKYSFSHSDILADIEYLENNRILSADFNESEVLVKPEIVKSRIVEKILE